MPSDLLMLNNQEYVYEGPLPGRGQAGAAGFYAPGGDKNRQVLIKEDDPGTCFAESMVVAYLPGEQVGTQILQASIGLVDGQTVSIQPRFMLSAEDQANGREIAAFDKVVFGRKRDPKTLFSEESRNANKIKETIGRMTPEVKKQLAAAIYMSQLNGDESLHIGQFMVVTEGDKITKISRIDFGALGRFAHARTDFDPLHTSELYQNSGQFGKDYVSYLLQDDEVKKYLLDYWKKTDVDEVVKQVSDRFDEQVKNLGGANDARAAALIGFYKSLVKDADNPKKQVTLAEIRELLIETTRERCTQMKAAAEIRDIQRKCEKFMKENPKYAEDYAVGKVAEKINKLAEDSSKPATERLREVKSLAYSSASLSSARAFWEYLKSLFTGDAPGKQADRYANFQGKFQTEIEKRNANNQSSDDLHEPSTVMRK
ncbi:hypothetical protein BN59_03571 [Legionella massiliensis]|uniref:Uncharacterized protein n=1 Tax=Legionella massiliensis TaxID=1034943 RepID=A0A078L5N6_9GAMM|nr:hypothetical protein [Legionella massiliensis]CDZ79253.1 hypothetical protein BN59_03571 [Legionella massiliensis]CEE14991.1 hypothetical protein BN1094_03571 [Legionella massiliensis]